MSGDARRKWRPYLKNPLGEGAGNREGSRHDVVDASGRIQAGAETCCIISHYRHWDLACH